MLKLFIISSVFSMYLTFLLVHLDNIILRGVLIGLTIALFCTPALVLGHGVGIVPLWIYIYYYGISLNEPHQLYTAIFAVIIFAIVFVIATTIGFYKKKAAHNKSPKPTL